MVQNTKKHKFPEIEFKVDINFEKEVALYFLEKDGNYFNRYAEDFPELKKAKEMNKEEAREFLSKRIDEIYRVTETKLERKKKEVEIGWDKIKDRFFLGASKLFDNHEWPSGEYTAVISVFNMFRYKPESKTFTIPSHDYAGNPPTFGFINSCIVHEMMHILFEDYFKTHFNKDDLELKKYYVLMEITNTIVLNIKEFTDLTGWKTYAYKEQEKDYKELKEIYNNCKTMKEFIEKGVEYFKNIID